jgi:hypothetical protein
VVIFGPAAVQALAQQAIYDHLVADDERVGRGVRDVTRSFVRLFVCSFVLLDVWMLGRLGTLSHRRVTQTL